MNVGAASEIFVHQRGPGAAKRRPGGSGHNEAAGHPGVDKFARGEPFSVTLADCRDLTADDWDDVCGRRADVDEQRVRVLEREKRGACVPIRRSDVAGIRGGFAEIDEPGSAGVQARSYRSEMIGRNGSQPRDALSA
jgi:hypothetical protein